MANRFGRPLRSSITTPSTSRRLKCTRSVPAEVPSPGSTRAETSRLDQKRTGSTRAGMLRPRRNGADQHRCKPGFGNPPERGLLGGKKSLNIQRAREAIRTRIAEPLGMSVEDAAAAIYQVQNAQTGDLLRKTVVEAGHDPRDFILYAFGGAGPANCAAYAAELGVQQAVVPLGPVASAFSAFGLATSDVVLTAELSDPATFPLDARSVERNFQKLGNQVLASLERQGLNFKSVELHRETDMRYSMQLAELPIPMDQAITAESLEEAAVRFERRYAELYGEGSGFSAAGIQAITYRVRAEGKLAVSLELPPIDAADTADPSAAQIATRPVRLSSAGYMDTAIFDYTKLRSGHQITGPAVIEVPTTT